MPRKKRDHEAEWEETIESGYQWPRAERISIYIYPAQLHMIEEISRVWKKKKRDIFFEAIQTYIGLYFQWKNQPTDKAEPK